jgi:hypothetical protein
LILFLLGGCSVNIPSPQERRTALEALASDHNLTIQPIPTPRFTLTSIVSNACADKVMRIYIEGDGFAWVTRSRISSDPTPINPLSAKLMMIDPSGCKAYIARPCQYANDATCTSEYWSNLRFSPEVIESYNNALDQLKQKYNIHSFTLIGYSGGGAVAALTAPRRNDVGKLISIAGNIDTDAWVNYHSISPLDGSLNPADEAKKLQEIPQIHLVGNEDTIVPKEILSSYKSHFLKTTNIKSIECNECTHNLGWEQKWGEYLKEN